MIAAIAASKSSRTARLRREAGRRQRRTVPFAADLPIEQPSTCELIIDRSG